ncbi:hypothetical protein AAE478_009161 [Parahypoxylon ruwenzoriense]
MADTRTLRVVTAATFLPAFPLCLAHGVVSHSSTPAVGLVPLAFSASVGVFLISRQRSAGKQKASLSQRDPERGDVGTGEERGEGEVAEGGHHVQGLESEYSEQGEGQGQGQEREDTQRRATPEFVEEVSDAPPATTTIRHPVLVFATDTVLAAALMIVLVFTWLGNSNAASAETAMLAAYATIPLLIHLYLAVRELSRGLAIRELTTWVAWQAVPPDCPDCGRRLRPTSVPQPPWLRETTLPKFHLKLRRPNVSWRPNIKIPAVRFPKIRAPAWKAPEWRTPAWLRRRGNGGDYAPLFVNPDADDDDEAAAVAPVAPYRDDPDAEGGPSTRIDDHEAVEPVVVDIVGKKSRRGRNSSSSP